MLRDHRCPVFDRTHLASIPRPNIATRSIAGEDLSNTVARLWGFYNSSGQIGKAFITKCQTDTISSTGVVFNSCHSTATTCEVESPRVH